MATNRKNTHQPSSRRMLVSGLALALIATALAIPGAATAKPVGAHVSVSDQAGQATAQDQSSGGGGGGGEPSGTSTAGAFDWGDAMIGAGGAVALIVLIGAGGFTLRVRQRMTPATPSQG
jgi:hypothetical protein